MSDHKTETVICATRSKGSRVTHPMPGPQSRRGSLVESATNVAIGYGIAVLSQIAIFPMFGIHVSVGSNFAIALWFTFVSLIRSYALRRMFNVTQARYGVAYAKKRAA